MLLDPGVERVQFRTVSGGVRVVKAGVIRVLEGKLVRYFIDRQLDADGVKPEVGVQGAMVVTVSS